MGKNWVLPSNNRYTPVFPGVYVPFQKFEPYRQHNTYYYKMQTFITQMNGGRPLRISIDDDTKTIHVYSNYDEDKYGIQNDETEVYKTQFIQYWIGKSSCGDPDFDGSSVLVNVADNKYVYICDEISSFTSYAPIIKYVSDMGNSNVPYPYAIDADGNVYLMIEDTVIIGLPELHDELYEDPYGYYYDRSNITKDIGCNREPVTLHPIKEWYVDGEHYTLRDSFEYERYKNKAMKVVYQDGTIKTIAADELQQICTMHRDDYGCRQMNKEIIIDSPY